MEEKGVGSLLVVCVVLGLLIGQSTASFKSCYRDCWHDCSVVESKPMDFCAVKCFGKCIFHVAPFENVKDTQYFCKLGCFTSMCTSLCSKQDPDEAQVESCVDSCSKTCARNI